MTLTGSGKKQSSQWTELKEVHLVIFLCVWQEEYPQFKVYTDLWTIASLANSWGAWKEEYWKVG